MLSTFKKSAAIVLVATLAGCASTAPKNSKDYDHTKSRALNIANAAGIDKLRDTKITEAQYQQIESSNFVMDAGWAWANYINPAPGFSSGTGLGIALASMIFTPSPTSENDSLIAWMPTDLAKDETQATELFRSELKSAIETALIDLGVVQPDIQLRESKDKSLHIWASFEHAQSQCGPYPPGTKGTDKCYVYAGIRLPTKVNAPAIVDPNQSPVYAFTLASGKQKLEVHAASESNLNELALYSSISENLPSWVFLYLAPKKTSIRNDEELAYPVVLSQGKANLFVIPAEK